MRRIIVVGATSAIAQEAIRIFAKRGDSLFLVGRSKEKLGILTDDLRARFPDSKVGSFAGAFVESSTHQVIVDQARTHLGGLDTALIAHGELGDQKMCEADFAEAERLLKVNFTSAASFASILANDFEKQGTGTIAAISSVAGDRGRQSNYFYGTSKGALSTFLSGLRNRLAPKGVRVVTIKPGFVDTPMTASCQKGLLWAKPDAVGKGVVRAIDRGADIVYLPGFWRFIMTIITKIPESIFKKLRL